MSRATSAAESRARLDERFLQLGPASRFSVPPRGWIRAVREALGMTTAQLAGRLGIKQPSVVALEKSEARGSIEVATLRRVAEALNCELVYALVPRESLESTIRARARSLLQRRGGPVAHSMLLENQQVAARGADARLEEALREMNPRVFWDDV